MSMHIIYLLLITLVLSSCDTLTKQTHSKPFTDSSTALKKNDHSKYYTKSDTVLIIIEAGDTVRYAKSDFNTIVNTHAEFFEEYPDNPDQTYANRPAATFLSEAAKDDYYLLYAYFLQQRNGVTAFFLERQKLIDIFSNINNLFRNFQYGGTYFVHQSRRILGYAEYSVYLIPKTQEGINKTYDITKQKELYIKSLRQLINDESNIDYITLGPERISRKQKLNTLVDSLDRLITDNFYLRRAQAFQYKHYEYY